VDSYLGLVALLSLFVGGIGVAQTVRAWIAGKTDAIAVLECLGLRPRQVLALFVAQTVLLALAGSAVGALAGALVQLAAPGLAGDLLPAGLARPWQPGALLRGLALGLGLALAFSLVPLLATLRVPPARVLRRDAAALAPGRVTGALAVGVLLAAVLLTATVQSRSLERGAVVTGGVLVAAGLLVLAGRAVAALAARAPREGLPLALRHGVAALGRPQAGTQSGVLALGLGTLVVLALFLVQHGLARELSTGMPEDAPTVFTIDVQPDQWPGVERLFDEHGATHVDSTPVVVARLAAVDGRPVEELVRERRDGRGSRWVLTREQRLTYRAELPADNRVVAGALWSDPARAEVSLEQDYADDLAVGLGQTLTFDVQGVPVGLVVTSLRTVEWKTFGINFFLIVEPGVLEEAPQFRIAAARVAAHEEQPLQDELVAAYPNVTMLRVREVLEKIVSVLGTIGLAVRVLGGFTVVAGVVILAGAVSAGSVRREREVALLETIGMTRGQVVRMLATEYALTGLVAGAIGAAGGTALAWGVLEQWMELDFEPSLAPLLVAVAATVALSVGAGIAASARALAVRPLAVLR
jgi:putative ABC transport system permease protein